MYGCDIWTIKKAEHRSIDTFELWCWRRLLKVPWTARRSNQSILKEISQEYSLEGLMLKLKLQYFGHLMLRNDSLEKTVILGKIEGRKRRKRQRMKWLECITDSIDMSLRGILQLVMDREAWCAADHRVPKSRTWLSDWTKLTEHNPALQGKTQISPQSVPPIRKLAQPSCPHPSEGKQKNQEVQSYGFQDENHIHRNLMKMVSWITALCNSVQLWVRPCRPTQNGWVMVKSSDNMWSTGEGNGKPLQYSCLKNLELFWSCLRQILFFVFFLITHCSITWWLKIKTTLFLIILLFVYPSRNGWQLSSSLQCH